MNNQTLKEEFTRFNFNFHESILVSIRLAFLNKPTIFITVAYFIYAIYSIFVESSRSQKLLELIVNPDIGYKIFMFFWIIFAIFWVILYPVLPIIIFSLLVSGYYIANFLAKIKKCSFIIENSQIRIKNQFGESTIFFEKVKFEFFGNLLFLKIERNDSIVIPIRLLSANDIDIIKSQS